MYKMKYKALLPRKCSQIEKPLSFKDVQGEPADRLFYLKKNLSTLQNKVAKGYQQVKASLKEMSQAFALAFALDRIHLNLLKPLAFHFFSSGLSFMLVETLLSRLQENYSDNKEDLDLLKGLLALCILSYSASQSLAEKRFRSSLASSAAVASEALAVFYMYSSSFQISRRQLGPYLDETYNLVASLALATLVIPGTLSYAAKSYQRQRSKVLLEKGSQRTDTAKISSGLSLVGNLYFQSNDYLLFELCASSRLFQLGLISDNILHSDAILKRFRNLPSLVIDLGPSLIKKLLIHYHHLEADYQYNTQLHAVLKSTKKGLGFSMVPRCQLKTNDLVHCKPSASALTIPLSGELIALAKNLDSKFIPIHEQKKCAVNLKTHNGEDRWIELQTKTSFDSPYSRMDLHAIQQGKQAGILSGAALNLYDQDNIFIQIKPEKILQLDKHYEKNAVIQSIIAERKKQNIIYALLASFAAGGLVTKRLQDLPAEALMLLFGIFQMLIPFSETFLRQLVNNRLMKIQNTRLEKNPLELIDALRLVDFCNALGGYYPDRFQAVTIISDKTGTLTTNTMEMLGIWTTEEKQEKPQDKESAPLLPSQACQERCFELFAAAYTHEKKELEPEEWSILNFFKTKLTQVNLEVQSLGKNHFKKYLILAQGIKGIESFHLGLYRSMGGRFTLMLDENQQAFLIFCGIPKPSAFDKMDLLQDYSKMPMRRGVLSRDWCLASSPISISFFQKLKTLFLNEENTEIEKALLSSNVLSKLKHQGTFLINNPIKKGAEHLIKNCRSIQVPVFIATGDTAKAAQNIVQVLANENSDNIILLTAPLIANLLEDSKSSFLRDRTKTLIFSGLDEENLKIFQQILGLDHEERPLVIFSEMSTADKGKLARFLKNQRFFVIANGDGSNDLLMMKEAHLVISHLTEDGTYAPGISALSNLSDRQAQALLQSEQSFYELFDIHQQNSQFIQSFSALANSQEKPTLALTLKSSKMSFELGQTLGFTALKEMPQQHLFSLGFDLIWLWISFQTINSSSALPATAEHLNRSALVDSTLALSVGFALVQSVLTYTLSGESINLTAMSITLGLLPLALKSLFSAYQGLQEKIYPPLENTSDRPKPNEIIIPRSRKNKVLFFPHHLRAPSSEEELNAKQDLNASLSSPDLELFEYKKFS